jgi:hypothetical protein
VKNPIDAFSCGHNGGPISDVALHDLKAAIVNVLLQIGAVADGEIVERANFPALREQTINEVAADKPGAPRYHVDRA